MDPNTDPNLNGENVETPAASPAETITPDDGSSVNPQQDAASLSSEEAKWNSLTGTTQERIRQLARENNRLREAESLKNQAPQYNYPQPNAYGAQTRTPEVESAVQRLSDVGIATDAKVEEKVNQKVAGLVYQLELDKLSDKYSGETGLPKFEREEYEDYVARHPQYRTYAPEDVYKKMYEPEITEWQVQNHGRQLPSKSVTPSLRPTRTLVREEALTPEGIEQRLNQPDGRQWYEQNRDKIQTVLAKTATPTW